MVAVAARMNAHGVSEDLGSNGLCCSSSVQRVCCELFLERCVLGTCGGLVVQPAGFHVLYYCYYYIVVGGCFSSLLACFQLEAAAGACVAVYAWASLPLSYESSFFSCREHAEQFAGLSIPSLEISRSMLKTDPFRV